MQALGPEADKDVRLYFTGGATAILFGWRTSTVDIDLKLEPDSDRVLRALPQLKESLYSQALAKIERGHSLDLEDVRKMLETGLVDRQELLRRFEQIEPRLHQYPAIDPVSFRQAVEALASSDE